MTRSRVKLLQEEMAKRIKDGVLIKGMEREKSQEAELEHVEDC